MSTISKRLCLLSMPLLLASCAISSPLDFSSSSKEESKALSQESTSQSKSTESSSKESTMPSSSSSSSAKSSVDPGSVHADVLFVGNSFTFYNNLDETFVSIGKSINMDLKASRLALGGQKLIDTASSTDPLGKQFDAALNHPYTHVVLQEHSTNPLNDYPSFLSGVKALKQKINAKLPNAEIYLYSTWGFQNLANSRHCTIPEAEAALRDAYRRCGVEAGVKVSYAGQAFSQSYVSHPEINLYFTDDKHPSYAGTYLAASTHLGTFFGVDIRPATFHGDSSKSIESGGLQYIAESYATTLRGIAYDVAFSLTSK
ncbi:MAG: SGNH/GDSL hydrolase family protein [Bacilli bacterium]|nr:SGNH/GDSL hydrolase family protein [Bacilli bacterium]